MPRIYTRKSIPTEKACKTCHNLFSIENYRQVTQPSPAGKNPYVYRRPNCKECESLISKKKQSLIRTPERTKRIHLKQYFNLTTEEWNFIFACQGKKCAICGIQEKIGRGWCTDHDHKTGKVRGILCCNCNLMIGLAKDRKQVLTNSISYLEDFEKPLIQVI